MAHTDHISHIDHIFTRRSLPARPRQVLAGGGVGGDHINHIFTRRSLGVGGDHINLTTFLLDIALAKARIKASRVAHLTDARYFAAKEVDYLGFNLEEGTEGYLDPMYMKAIREWVEGPKIVGEFSHTPIRVVQEAAAFFGLDVVQLSAQNHGAYLAELEGLEIILEIEMGAQGLPFSKTELHAFAPYADIFLFNFSQTNVSKSIFYAEKDFWREVFALRPSLLQADIPASDWPEILETLGLVGLSLVGGEEEQVGVKSYDQVDDIFESLGRG